MLGYTEYVTGTSRRSCRGQSTSPKWNPSHFGSRFGSDTWPGSDTELKHLETLIKEDFLAGTKNTPPKSAALTCLISESGFSLRKSLIFRTKDHFLFCILFGMF